jgi:hypothetical protein
MNITTFIYNVSEIRLNHYQTTNDCARFKFYPIGERLHITQPISKGFNEILFVSQVQTGLLVTVGWLLLSCHVVCGEPRLRSSSSI